MTESETIKEAEETVAFIRKLQAEEADIREALKEKRSEIDAAEAHLCALFEADANDADRPLLDANDDEMLAVTLCTDLANGTVPSSVTLTGEHIKRVSKALESLPIKRPRNASKR